MPSRRTAVYAVLIATALSRPAGAQVRADPGAVTNGRIAVRVYVTLSDEETPPTAERTTLASDVQSAGSSSSTTAASAQFLDEDGKPIVQDPSAPTMYSFFLTRAGVSIAVGR